MNTAVLREMSERSMAGTITFPEVVKTLSESGVESYSVDLVRNVKTYYSGDGMTFTETFEFRGPSVAPEFSAAQVADSVRASQAGAIKYREFLMRIMAAGTMGYSVFIDGGKVVYWGRRGDAHVESFPAGK